jgi:hypothetical protein
MDWLRILLTPLKVNSIPLASWLILSGFLASRQEYPLGSTSKSDALKLYLSEYRLVLSDFISATNHY